MRIKYVDGPRLRRALLAACEYAQQRRLELNRINVFPVPDGDTGTNLSLTLGSISDRLRWNREESVSAVAREVAEAGVLGARGNCGMILSHFLLGFSNSVDGRRRLGAADFARALRDAVEHVYRALEKPVEGTIVTVMRETAEAAEAHETRDFAELLEVLLERAQEALERTPELLPALRAAGVVDAGAKGFVHLLEGVVGYIHGEPFVTLDAWAAFMPEPAAAQATAAAGRVELGADSERYRFCTEVLVRGGALPDERALRERLHGRGDSLLVIRTGDLLKVHIHTDDPEALVSELGSHGRLVAHKAEDMRAQHEAIRRSAGAHARLARRAVAVLADSGCNLPDEVIRAHGIHVVPLSLIFEDRVYRDRVDMSAEDFARRLVAGEHGTTSQPAPAAFLEAYREAALDGESVVGVLLGSALSGTYASAEAAARGFEAAPVRLVDSRAVSLSQGLLTLLAAELAEAGRDAEAIAAELDRVRGRSGFVFTVDVFDNLLRSGRVGRGRVWLAGLLDIKPILGLDADGKVVPIARARGRATVLPRLLAVLEERIPRNPRRLRFGIVHVARESIVAEIAAALRERWGEREIISAPASPVIATHAGPGAFGVAYQVED